MNPATKPMVVILQRIRTASLLDSLNPEELVDRPLRVRVGQVLITLSAERIGPDTAPPDPADLVPCLRPSLRAVYESVVRLRNAPGGSARKVWPRTIAAEIEESQPQAMGLSTINHALEKLRKFQILRRTKRGYELPKSCLF